MNTPKSTIAAAGLAACIAPLAPALAQTVEVATHTDAADAIPGALEISELPGAHAAPGPDSQPVIDQLPGFPITIGSSPSFSPWRGPVLVDLDGSGDLEILQSSTAGRLHAWHHDATPVAGFPQTTIGFPQYPPSVADMDGDGDMEIVLFTRGLTSGGRMYIFDHTGAVLPGFPLSFDGNNLSAAPTLYDLDDDGVMEVIADERAWPIGYLHVVELDGSVWDGNWPVTLSHVPTGTPAVADLDQDGEVEIFSMSYDQMYLLGTDGTPRPGWPRGIAGANFSYQSAALADLDGNGDLEIAVAAHQSAAGAYVFHHDGALASGWPHLFGTWSYCPPTVTDLEGDGALEVIAGRAGVFFGSSACFWVLDASGDVRPGFPYVQPTHGGGSEGPMTVADIDGDGVMEIFADHNVTEGGIGYLFGVDAAGNDLPGFPLRPQGFTHLSSATIADVDGNGTYELAVTSFHDLGTDVNLYTLPTSYSVTGREWPTYHARYTRDGLYAPDAACYADCDESGDLDFFDFLCFQNAFATGDPYADCDDSGTLDFFDFLCFQNAFAAGCP